MSLRCKSRRHGRRHRPRCRDTGFGLPELLIALLIGGTLMAGALRLFQTASASYRTLESLAELQERAAFALNSIAADILHAGNWGLHNDGTRIAVPATIGVHCAGADARIWALRPEIPVAAGNGTLNIPCPAFSAPVAGSDSLTLRYAGTDTAIPEAGRLQIHTSAETGVLFADGAPPPVSGMTTTRNMEVRTWYLDQRSSERGLPALRRYTLVDNGLLQNQEIIPGIEDFQVLLGIDRNADGRVDGFVNPDMAGSAPVLALRVWLLLRSTRRQPGHIDAGPWRSIDEAAAARAPHDRFRRLAVERTFALRNARRL